MVQSKLKGSKSKRTSIVSVPYHTPAIPQQHCVHWYASEQCCNCGEHGSPNGAQLNTHCQPDNV